MRQYNFPVPENVLQYITETKVHSEAELESVLEQVEEQHMTEFYQNLVAELKAEGRQAGLYEGLQEGRQEGLQEGRQEGLQEGRQVGIQEGHQVGFNDAMRDMARRLLKEKQSIEFVMKITGLSRMEIEALRGIS